MGAAQSVGVNSVEAPSPPSPMASIVLPTMMPPTAVPMMPVVVVPMMPTMVVPTVPIDLLYVGTLLRGATTDWPDGRGRHGQRQPSDYRANGDPA